MSSPRLLVSCALTALVAQVPGPAVLAQTRPAPDVFSLSLEELRHVKVVTASRAEQDSGRVPASVVVVTREDIALHGYTSLVEILQHIPGLFLVDQYNWSGVTGVGVRGYFTEGSFSNVVVMVDGITVLREGYINQYVLARIAPPVEAIDRIEVIRGPMSVMYGENAFFGAINVITLTRNKTVPTEVLVVKAGSEGSQEVVLRLEQERSGLTTVLDASLRRTSGIDVPYSRMTSNRPVPVASGGTETFLRSVGLSDDARTGRQLGGDGLYARLSAAYDRLEFSMGYSSAEHGILWRAPSHHPDGSTVRVTGADLRLHHEQPIGSRVTLNTRLQHARYQSTSRYRLYGDDRWGQSLVRSSLSQVTADLHVQAASTFTLSGGILYEQMDDAGDDVDIPAIPNVGNSSWRLADGDAIWSLQTYAQGRWQASPRLLLVGGVRLFHFGDFVYQRLKDQGLPTAEVKQGRTGNDRLHTAAQAAALVNTGARSVLKLLVGSAVTAPNLRQLTTRLDFALTRPDVDLSGLPALEPSRISTYEAQFQATPRESLLLGASVYHNELDRLIVSAGTTLADGRYVVVTQNTGRIQTTGLEVSLKHRPHRNLDLDIGLSYQHSANLEAGHEMLEVPYSPRLLLTFGAGIRLTPHMTASMTGLRVGSMEASWRQTGSTPVQGLRTSVASPSYVLLGANWRVDRLGGTPLFLNVRASNLLDADVRYPADPANAWADLGFVGAGRRVQVSLGYAF